jgi:hypothetical protein
MATSKCCVLFCLAFLCVSAINSYSRKPLVTGLHATHSAADVGTESAGVSHSATRRGCPVDPLFVVEHRASLHLPE